MYRYGIYVEQGVVVVYFRGRVTVAELMDYFTEIAADSNYRPDIHGVFDFRDATLDMDVEALKELAEESASSSTARWVIIVDNPHDTAFSVLYSDIVCAFHPLVVVSFEDMASKYLDIDIHPLLEELKTSK